MIDRRVLFWAYYLPSELISGLRQQGFNVVCQLQGKSPDVPSHSTEEIFTGQDIPPASSAFFAVPDELLWEYSQCIGRVMPLNKLATIDTLSIGPIIGDVVHDWAQLHYARVQGLLDFYMPDEIWLIDIPHLGIDNLLAYEAIRRGLKVLIFRQTSLPEKFQAFSRQSGTWQTVRAADFSTVDRLIERPVVPIRDLQPAIRATFLSRIQFVIFGFFSLGKLGFLQRLYLAATRRNWDWLRLAIELGDSNFTAAAFYRYLRVKRYRSLQANFKMATPEHLKRFAFFALHYEPEANVRMFSDSFANQVNAIAALAAWLPPNYPLIVKENPLQRHYARDTAFYKRLELLPNVFFVTIATPSDQLISKATLVATIAGTVGFEALLVEKPVICFGRPWYLDLPGAHFFSESLQFEQVIQTSTRSELEKVLAIVSRQYGDGVVFPRFTPLGLSESQRKNLFEKTADSMARLSVFCDNIK